MPTTFPTSDPTLLCRVTVVADEADVSREMASRMLGQVREKPHAVLGVATGSSPSGGYRVLREAATPGAFARVRVFALDEYVGLPAGHDRSYRRELETQVIEPLGIDPHRLHLPDPAAPQEYDARIDRAGGVDLQILGIGQNGHIAFNEPGSSPHSLTRVVDLAEQTRSDNARFFADPSEVPRRAVTQGVGTISRARRLVMVASGARKSDAVGRMLFGEVGPDSPASFLRRHRDLELIVDRALWEGM